MPIVDSAPAVATSRRHDLSEFRAAASSSFVPLHVTSDDPEGFRGMIRSGEADGIHLSDVQATPHVVERTPELIARSTRAAVKVSVMLSGTGLLIQDGREALLRPGDFAVYDTSRPYTLAFGEDFRTVVLMFAPEALNVPARLLAEVTGVGVKGDNGLGALAAPFIAQLGTHLEQFTGASGPRLAHTALDLLSTVYTSELGLHQRAVDPHVLLRQRIRDYIDEHLAWAELTPRSIAAAHYISPRHLHGLFHDEGTTVSALIRTRRLEQCRRDLRNPLLADVSVAGIGARWGFPDAAHFSRTFKAAFGVAPSDFRAR